MTANRRGIESISTLVKSPATNVRLTDSGWIAVQRAAPGHVAHVRRNVFDPLSSAQVSQLTEITRALLARLDPEGTMRPADQSGVGGQGAHSSSATTQSNELATAVE